VVPHGAHPSYAAGYYDRDNVFYASWDPISRDRASFGGLVLLQSLPAFWIGTMLIFFVGIQWKLLPVFGYRGLQSCVLPGIALAATFVPILARGTRHAVSELMQRDFIVNLGARGIPTRRIVCRHVLRHLGLPIVTLIGAQTGLMLGATFIIEYIFNYPGLGKLGVDAVLTRDLPTTQGVVMTIATMVIGINVLVELSYVSLDPRLRR
jgi:peptide/nickel transport system permease protein